MLHKGTNKLKCCFCVQKNQCLLRWPSREPSFCTLAASLLALANCKLQQKHMLKLIPALQNPYKFKSTGHSLPGLLLRLAFMRMAVVSMLDISFSRQVMLQIHLLCFCLSDATTYLPV